MCPDRQIISLYLDGELPSPWKEKMYMHLETCEKCRASLEKYRLLGERLRDLPDDVVEAAQNRVWNKFMAPGMEIQPLRGGMKREWPGKRIWSRSITLPLPAAAAAAVLVIIVFVALFGIRNSGRVMPQDIIATAGIGLDDQGTVPIQDMNGVLQYLSSQDNGDFMVIRLPESRRFSRTGKPAFINAADYSRRTLSQ